MTAVRSENASAGGLFLSTGTAPGYLAGASLRAAGADATATIRNGGPGGDILAILAAATKTADHFIPPAAIFYTAAIHVTITGAAAELIVYQA